MLRGLLLITTFLQLSLFALEQNALKAVFLERFTRFIEWPAISDYSNQRDFTICVVNDTSFLNTLKDIYKNKPIKNRIVSVYNLKNTSDIKQCSMLYIGQNTHSLATLIQEAKEHHVLTLSHQKGFANKGVIINFYLEDKRMRYEINNQVAKQSDLNISYLLLKSARLIAHNESIQ